jgi:sulfonate transport system substrate-binding protein
MRIPRRRILQVAAAGAWCLGRRGASAARTVRIGYQKYGLLVVLKARGTLERALAGRGWSIAWSEFPGGIQLAEALQAGRLDFGVVGEGPPIFAQAAGAPLVYLGAEPPAPAGEAILVARDAPWKSVADLRGRQVVVNKGANAHYLLIRALEEARVGYDEVKISFVPPAGARAAFESGQVQAWAIWDPFLASAQKATGARVLRDGRGLVENPGYYIGTRDFAGAHGGLVDAILEEIGRTGAWANANAGAVVAQLAPLLGIDPEALRLALGRSPFGVMAVSDELLVSQQKVADTFARLKLIPHPIRVADARWDRSPPSASATRR